MYYYIKKYWKYVLAIIAVIISFIIMYFYDNKDENENVSITKVTTKQSTKSKDSNSTVFVDVKGAVNNPGVYEIEGNKRVMDAINLAGGLSSDANTININLSKKVEDEMYIVVYTKNEIYNFKKKNGNDATITCASNECDCPDSNNDACINKSNNNSSNNSKTDSVAVSDKISINNASKEELMTLSGIGEAKASAIISYREENGSFKTIEDIKNVSGIGDALFNKIKDNITL